MKILLAGPLPKSNKNGGVAVFDKNLALELHNQGNTVEIISAYNGTLDNNIKVIKFYHIRKILNQFKPDLIISSLAYSALFIIFSTKAIKVHLLHAFTDLRNYRWSKFVLMTIFDRIVRHHFNFILSNSRFTNLINKDIYNIQTDGIFKIGVNDQYLKKIKHYSNSQKNSSVLYLGRMVDIKNIRLIYEAFQRIDDKQNKYHLNFVGYGPESNWIKEQCRKNQNISFLGFVNNDYTFRYYNKAKVFISLNPAEPFGITFVEALLNNDFIVAPNTGGQVDLLKHFPNRCRLVNINNVKEITQAIQYGLKQKLEPFSQIYNLNNFSYAQTWNDIQKVINSKKRRY